MLDEDAYRREARIALSRIDVAGVHSDTDKLSNLITNELWRFRQPRNKFIFLDEAIHFVQAGYDKHLLICTVGPTCLVNQGMEKALSLLKKEIEALPESAVEVGQDADIIDRQPPVASIPIALSSLHPTIQQTAGSRFASGHYSDAIQKACTALEKVVQAKAGQPATVTGTSLMTTAFSKNSPLIQVAADPNEQFGFMNLYQGTVQALRNHYAHNLTELTDPARALEWLGFISALFYKLDEAQPPTASPAP